MFARGSCSRAVPWPRLLGGAALVLGLAVGGTALADIDPPGCTGNSFSVDLDKNAITVVPGQIVTYSVKAENEGGGCSVNQVTIDFFCPAADGTSTGPSTNVVTDGAFAAGFPLTTIGTFDCTMPQFTAGVLSAQARVQGTGNLRDSAFADPFDILKTVSVAVLTCDVQVDKQISCDGGLTWADALLPDGTPQYAPDGTNGCSTLGSDPVLVRYFVRDNGTADLSECVLNESNALIGGQVVIGSLLPGVDVPIPRNPSTCSAIQPGEPDTATVSCSICNGVTLPTPVTDEDSATVQCLAAELKTDKQVTCGGGIFADNYGLTADNDLDNGQAAGVCFSPDNCQTQGCKAPFGATVGAKYQAANTGTATLFACQLVDTNADFGTVPVGTLTPGQVVQTNVITTECDADLNTREPNTVSLRCCIDNVGSLLDCGDGRSVQVSDSATIQCLAPDLNVTKACELNAIGESIVTVEVTNTGQAALANCVATDLIYTQDPTCDAPPPPPDQSTPETGPTTVVPLTGSPIASLPPGSPPVVLSGSIVLEAEACNTVQVTCDVVGGGTITRFAEVECPAPPTREGCLTRTPGFWGNHPFLIAGDDPRSLDLLPIEVCGQELNTTAAFDSHSTTEAICSVGKDGKILGPQLTQLIRQCTAAKLNVAASQALEGDCAGTAGTAQIDELLAGCCDTADTCVDGSETFRVNFCISALDAFNNFELDSLNFPFNTGPADSSICRDAKNNNVIVIP